MILNLSIYSGLFYGLARGLCLKESYMCGFRCSRRFPIDLPPGYSIRL